MERKTSWKRASQPKVGASPVAQKPANPPPSSEPSRRKSPSKLRKDQVKWVFGLKGNCIIASLPRSAPVCVELAGLPLLKSNHTLLANSNTCYVVEMEQSAGEDEDVYAAALQTIRDVPVPEPINSTVSSPGGTSLTMLQPMKTNTEEAVPPSTQHRENTDEKQEPEFEFLAVLQPVVPGIPQLDGEDGMNSKDETSDDETSNDETSDNETSDDETSDDETSNDKTSDNETSDNETSDGERPDASSHSPLAAPPREAAAPPPQVFAGPFSDREREEFRKIWKVFKF